MRIESLRNSNVHWVQTMQLQILLLQREAYAVGCCFGICARMSLSHFLLPQSINTNLNQKGEVVLFLGTAGCASKTALHYNDQDVIKKI